MRRIAALLSLVGIITIIERVLVYFDFIQLSMFFRYIVPAALIFFVCRFFGIWPFSGG
jgi:hypothetical protein